MGYQVDRVGHSVARLAVVRVRRSAVALRSASAQGNRETANQARSIARGSTTTATKPIIFLEISVTKAFAGKPEGF